jgi:hypothetical protein
MNQEQAFRLIVPASSGRLLAAKVDSKLASKLGMTMNAVKFEVL